jgi:hypothetical protein
MELIAKAFKLQKDWNSREKMRKKRSQKCQMFV